MPNVMWSSPPSKLCSDPRAMTSATSGIESRLGSRVGTGDGEAAAGDLATGPVEPRTLPAQPAETRSNALTAAAVRRRLDGKVEPVRRDWDWVVAEVVASATELMAEAEPVRLKACANPGCTWMFWDESKNVSRRWCDPRTCGNLVTVREFR